MIEENRYHLISSDIHWIIQWIFQRCFKVNVWVPLAVWHWSTKALQTEVPGVPWVAPLSLAPGERVQRGILPFGGQSWWKPKDWGFHRSPDMSRPNRNNKHINCQHQEKLHLTSLPHSDPVEWAQTLPDVGHLWACVPACLAHGRNPAFGEMLSDSIEIEIVEVDIPTSPMFKRIFLAFHRLFQLRRLFVGAKTQNTPKSNKSIVKSHCQRPPLYRHTSW